MFSLVTFEQKCRAKNKVKLGYQNGQDVSRRFPFNVVVIDLDDFIANMNQP